MAGLLSETTHCEEFLAFLISNRLKASSGRSYVTYINNLCRNMAVAGTRGATTGNALDVLLSQARAHNSEQAFLEALTPALAGPRGRSPDLRSAAVQFYQYARRERPAAAPTRVPRVSGPVHGCQSTSAFCPSLDRIEWLREEPPDDVQASLEALFAQVFEDMKGRMCLWGRSFDRALRGALVAAGCDPVSSLDSRRVLPGAKYTVDIAATAPDGTRLLLEIEKAEVKRVVHDLLKIAAGQKNDPGAVGLLIVPDRYRTENRAFSRTHLQEARAVMDLLTHSHPWASGALGVVVYSGL